MDEGSFSQAVSLLSGEHSLAILRYLAPGEWRIASDVSRALHIHTTTASKFLAGMHALGFLDRRVESDVQRFKEYIEGRGTETGAFRGEIHGSEVRR